MPSPSSPQTERDAAILEHLRRYHLTTPEILHRLFFRDANLNAVRKVTLRLICERRIRRARLFEQRIYFVLTPREAERLGEDRRIGKPFEYQGLVNALAILAFCAEHEIEKFTPKEFAQEYPGCVIKGVRSGNYYRDPYDTPDGRKERLGFIHVDYGTSSETIVKKIRKIISRPFTKPTKPKFVELVHNKKFVVAILTPTAAKAEEIKLALAKERTGDVLFRIVVVNELGELLTRRGRLKENRRRREPGQDGSPVPTKSRAAEPPALPTTPSTEAPLSTSVSGEAAS